jgi:hypothetical protein
MVCALLLGTGILLASMFCFGVTMALIVHLVSRLMRNGYAGSEFWRNVAVMMTVTLLTTGAHLGQIAFWAAALVATGEISTFATAFYLSAQDYTALGYGDVTLSDQWRLLGPLEAINGLLVFGLSTAMMFAILSRLVTSRLRKRSSHGSRERRPSHE